MNNILPSFKVALTALLVGLLSACASISSEGDNAANRGDWAAAEKLYTQAIRSGEHEAWNNLGVVRSKQKNHAGANQAFHMAARYGDPVAVENLQKRGLPVPAPDLLHAVKMQQALSDAQLANSLANIPTRRSAAPAAPPGPVICNTTVGTMGANVGMDQRATTVCR